MARAIVIGCCIVLLSMVILGASGTSAVHDRGSFALAPANGSAAGGTVSLSADDRGALFISVQAWGLSALSSAGVALTTPQCGAVVTLLNPIATDGGGEGAMTTELSRQPSLPIWIALLSAGASSGSVLACGHQPLPASAAATPQPSLPPLPTIQVPAVYVTQFPTVAPAPRHTGPGNP
jgi:hypothetical protein